MHGHELLKPLLQRTHMISLARGEDRVGRRAVTALGLVEHGLQLGFLVARALQIRCQCAPLALDLLYVPLVLLLRAQQLLTRAVRLHPPLLLEPCFLAFAEKLGRLRRELELGCHLLDLLHRHAHIARGRRGRSHRTLHGASCCGSRQRCHWWRRWRRVVHAWGHRGRAGARCAHFVALIDVRVKPLVVLLELLNMQPQLLALELGFLSQVSERRTGACREGTGANSCVWGGGSRVAGKVTCLSSSFTSSISSISLDFSPSSSSTFSLCTSQCRSASVISSPACVSNCSLSTIMAVRFFTSLSRRVDSSRSSASSAVSDATLDCSARISLCIPSSPPTATGPPWPVALRSCPSSASM
mmetsp:Transcript_86411/g.244057  ORF Transcript_86411/g.244057 Transcript_86411/m.244057 type:complete len:357 (-) Transcript_86411:1132-2202(-)